MSTRNILHVSFAEKFLPNFIHLVNEKVDVGLHTFLIFGALYEVDEYANVYRVRSSMQLLRAIRSADQVILHGLFGARLFFTLMIAPKVLKKCFWVMWGADLYSGLLKKKTIRDKIVYRIRRVIIERIGHLITYIDGDFELAESLFGAKAARHECIMYPSNTFKLEAFPAKIERDKSTINILVGNSAAMTNNHSEVLDALAINKDYDIKIYCPLSYGDPINARIVTKKGKQIFGEKFIPLLEFLPYKQYQELLSKIDIGIFGHKRQQAMGNTISLIGLGAKVFMRRDVTQFSFLSNLGVKIYDVNNLNLSLLESVYKENNQRIIAEQFSEERLIEQLLLIFRRDI